MAGYLSLDRLQLRRHGQRIRANILPNRKFKVRQALQWISCGWRIWRKNLFFWWVLAIIYTLFVYTVTRVPFLGTFFVLLLTPGMAAGVLSTVRQQLTPGETRSTVYLLRRARSAKERLFVLVGRPAWALVTAFTDEDKMLGLMGVGFATAFLGVFAQIFMLNLGGAFYVTADTLPDVGFLQGLRLVIAYGSMFVLCLVLIVVNIYFLSLYILDNKPLGTALIAGLHACMQNAVPCLVYGATLATPLLVSGMVAEGFSLIGFVALLAAGSVALPLLCTSAYCTSRLMYRV